MVDTLTARPAILQRATNYYDDLFVRLIGDGVPQRIGVERVATAYLDGKPLPVGKKKLTKKERDSLFWTSGAVTNCPPDAWNAEAMSLALARYLGREPIAAEGLVTRVAREAPDQVGDRSTGIGDTPDCCNKRDPPKNRTYSNQD